MSFTDDSELGSVLQLEKSTGFDASPNAEREDTLSRRPTRLIDPRSPLSQWISSPTSNNPVTHPLAYQKTTPDAIVTFDGPEDPYRPLNWERRKKWITVILYGLTTMCSSWNTSIFSSDIATVAKEYDVANVVSTLGVTLFLFGSVSVSHVDC
jgi:hypothetical protein